MRIDVHPMPDRDIPEPANGAIDELIVLFNEGGLDAHLLPPLVGKIWQTAAHTAVVELVARLIEEGIDINVSFDWEQS